MSVGAAGTGRIGPLYRKALRGNGTNIIGEPCKGVQSSAPGNALGKRDEDICQAL